jgi:hypothetical protein
MTKKKDARPIARMDCLTPECGGQRAAVYQNTRHYLYTRCPGCKCNQDNSAERQVAVWQRMEPLPGAVIHRPRNVPASAGAPGCALVAEAEPATVVIDPAPAPAAIGAGAAPEPAAEPAARAGAEPATEAVKTEENLPPPATEEPAPAAPAGEPAPAPETPQKKRRGGGLFWGVLVTLSLVAAGAAAVLSGGNHNPEGA